MYLLRGKSKQKKNSKDEDGRGQWMIEMNLPLIATAIGIVASIWKFANSISKFGHSVDTLMESMEESKKDRMDLRERQNKQELSIVEVKIQHAETKEDLQEIKNDLKVIKRKVS